MVLMRDLRIVEAFHEPPKSLGLPFRFMVPMRDLRIVEAFHEPEITLVDFEPLTHFRFMAGEQVQKEQGAFHEPEVAKAPKSKLQAPEKLQVPTAKRALGDCQSAKQQTNCLRYELAGCQGSWPQWASNFGGRGFP
jgi:hypothetical protein